MKKYGAFILTLTLVLTLSACGKSESPDTNDQGTKSNNDSNISAPSNSTGSPTDDFLKTITAETAEATGVCGADLTWYYKDNVLVIKGTGPMTEYNYADDVPWNNYKDNINKLVIDEGCTEISSELFRQYPNLASVFLPDSIIKIGQGVFANNDNLVLTELGSGLQIIDNYAFEECVKLASINMPDSVVTLGHGVFIGCKALESIKLSTGLSELGYNTFFGCNSLKSITLSDGITELNDNPFANCENLTEINIPSGNFILENGALFSADKSTLIALIPNNVTEYTVPQGVTTIGDCAFRCATKLTLVNMPDSIINIGSGAFLDCHELEKIDIPEGITEIKGSTFMNCKNLHSICFPASIVEIDENAFLDCRLSSIQFKGDIPVGADTVVKLVKEGDKTIQYSGFGFDKMITEYPDINWIKQ